jgi:hypothetical protein
MLHGSKICSPCCASFSLYSISVAGSRSRIILKPRPHFSIRWLRWKRAGPPDFNRDYEATSTRGSKLTIRYNLCFFGSPLCFSQIVFSIPFFDTVLHPKTCHRVFGFWHPRFTPRASGGKIATLNRQAVEILYSLPRISPRTLTVT